MKVFTNQGAEILLIKGPKALQVMEQRYFLTGTKDISNQGTEIFPDRVMS